MNRVKPGERHTRRHAQAASSKTAPACSRDSLWLRPVSDRENEEVSEYERQYADGSDPRVLDIIDVPLLDAPPKDISRRIGYLILTSTG